MANEKLAKLNDLKAMGEAAKAAINKVEQAIPKNVSELTNDQKYQTESEVTAAISSQIGRVYKPCGTLTFAELPSATAELLGNVYNVSDDFTTDDRFVDGAGKFITAGSNVAVVKIGEDYKLDVLSGAVDLTNYVQKDGDKTLTDNNYSDEDVAKLGGVAEGATKVESSTTDGNIKINGVETPVVAIATDEEAAAVINAIFPTA